MHVTRRGGPEVLSVRDLHLPPPAAGEVLVEVQAAGVAFGDILLREGLRRAGPGPLVPGYDAAGTVVALGPGVDGLAVGDAVAVWTQGRGGYATHVLAPAWAAVAYPGGLDAAAVVALVLNYLTAWQLLHRTAAVADGSTILVHAAAGGVGTALLQLAALRDVRVLGTASAGKAGLVRDLGAVPIDYRAAGAAAAIKREAPEGIDAIFDALGSRSWRQDLALLRPGGHLVVYGLSSAFSDGRRSLPAVARNVARVPRTSYLTYFRRSVGVTGYSSEIMVPAHHDWFRRDLAGLIDLLARDAIAPVIHASYPLDQAGRAHAELGAGRLTGKIVLTAA